MLTKRLVTALAGALSLACAVAATAEADFPYQQGGSAADYSTYHVNQGTASNDVTGDGNDWKYASTQGTDSAQYATNPKELFGVRGGHVADTSLTERSAWMTTTGRPDVAIAVLDSGIKWNDRNAMHDLRLKVRINAGELPTPQTSGPALVDGVTCASYTAGTDDANGDHVFNLLDYACDPRVKLTGTPRAGPSNYLTPQDLTIAFSDGTDDDHNGFTDDIAGWDFLDNDNDPYDDVQYGHGTGEAIDSSAEANNGPDLDYDHTKPPPASTAGSCPNCMVVPLRVGDSFVADANRFGQAAIYATDNDVLVIQEALGTLNASSLARDAIDYAYKHGTVVIASAADEAAQHHNWPSTYAKTIVVNSVDKYNQEFTPNQPSYLDFNGCTNFSTKVTLSIPSSSCSSNATGVGAGMAGLVYSAALNARQAGTLDPSPDSGCERVGGAPCVITPNEVRQLMASGEITPGNTHANAPDATHMADDVNFISGTEPSCGAPSPGADCTDPNRFFPPANDPTTGRPVLGPTSPFVSRSYPAHKGFDQYYGYGRVNMVKAVEATKAATIPPEAEITSPDWYQMLDPDSSKIGVQGYVNARGHGYTCKVEVAPGSDPTNDADFQQVAGATWCDGTTVRSVEHQGPLAQIDVAALKASFPASAGDFHGRAPRALENTSPDGPHQNNRPAKEPFGFTIRVVVTSVQGAHTLKGQDRRNAYLHRDADLRPGFPKTYPSDGASSPALADLDGDNRNDLVFGTSDGRVHALDGAGNELPGFPVHTDPLALHTGGHAFSSGEVPENASFGAILASTSVADIDHDGSPEVVAADMEGKLYVWDSAGTLEWKREANPAFSGKPLQPFHNVRCPVRCRTQHGFIASPVLANLDGSPDGKLDVIAAGMDRHVYAFRANGDAVPGYPVLVVDRDQITAIDPTTHVPTFKSGLGGTLNQGAIVDTPAVGDLTGDGKLEIVVGTNEEYDAAPDTDNPGTFFDGGLNAGFSSNTLASLTLVGGFADILQPANSRLYAIKSTGDPSGGSSLQNGDMFISGWPKKVGILLAELLPVVGEGITGSPVIGDVTCANGGGGNKVGVIPGAGPGYVFNADGTSCYGQEPGMDGKPHDRTLASDGEGFSSQGPKYDTPMIPAVGHPAFGKLDPAGTVSFLAPAAGVIRSLDVAFPEYQGGQDFLGVWNANSGQFSPGWPVPVNDLQFLTGPSVADVDGQPGEEALGGTASLDLNAIDFTAQPLAAWPKFTADWMVANPLIGSFGELETDTATHNSVISMTRSGVLFAYKTPAPACPLGSWPRFHHDNANSGVLDRDAVSPGKPLDAHVAGSALTFKAPGDDLLCGKVDHYEVVTSDVPIRPRDFTSPAVVKPNAVSAAGENQSLALPFELRRYVAVRAVDAPANGNVGRIAVVDRSAPAGGSDGSGNGGNDGGSGGSGGSGGNGGGGAGGGGGGSLSGCSDKLAPRSTISRRALHASSRRFSVRGHSRDRGCAGLRRVYVYISRKAHVGKCRFVTRHGRLSHRRSCHRPHPLRATGKKGWHVRISRRLPRGHYKLVVRALDRKGNRERARKGNTLRFRVR